MEKNIQMIAMSKKAKLKCPFCGNVDMCRHLDQE